MKIERVYKRFQPEVNMYHRQLAATRIIATLTLSALILSASLSVAQTAQPRRAPGVPYVPTTEEAVQAMLKLAGVRKIVPELVFMLCRISE